MTDYVVIEPCKTTNSIEVKLTGKRIELTRAERALSKLGSVAARTPVVLLFKSGEYSISIYASGRMMMKCDNKLDDEAAERLACDMLQ